MRILVRATNWIGDAVMSLPALRAIRRRYPDAEIAVLAKPWVSALYDRESSIDRVIALKGQSGARDWRPKWKLIRDLRTLGPMHYTNDPLLNERIQAALANEEQVEMELRRKVEATDAGGNVRSSSGEIIPPGYSDATAKYFEQLSKTGGKQ